MRSALGNFLSLSIPIERTWISDSGPVTAIRHSAFQCLELNSVSAVFMLRYVPCFVSIISKNEASLHPNGDEYLSFIPSCAHPNSFPFLLPLCPLPNSILRSDKPKLKDQDCKSFSFNVTFWFQLQAGYIRGKKYINQFMSWQFWCLSHISKISLKWKSNRNNNHSLMNTISILVYRKIGSRQDFTTKKGTSQ